MQLKELNLESISIFLDEILRTLDKKEISDTRILILTRILDPTETKFHVEGNSIWKAEHWRKCLERQELFRKQQAEDNEKLDARKIAFNTIIEGIYVKIGLEKMLATKLAEKIVNENNVGAAHYFTDGKLDLANVPSLPTIIYRNLDDGYTLRG